MQQTTIQKKINILLSNPGKILQDNVKMHKDSNAEWISLTAARHYSAHNSTQQFSHIRLDSHPNTFLTPNLQHPTFLSKFGQTALEWSKDCKLAFSLMKSDHWLRPMKMIQIEVLEIPLMSSTAVCHLWLIVQICRRVCVNIFQANMSKPVQVECRCPPLYSS